MPSVNQLRPRLLSALCWTVLVCLGSGSACPNTELPPLQEAFILYPGNTDGPTCTPDDLLVEDSDALRAHFIDVGQGDSIWLRIPSGLESDPVDLLVDTGDGPLWPSDTQADAGAVISDYMEAHDVFPGTLLDWLVITHGDRDHYGGTGSVLDRYSFENFLGSGFIGEGETWNGVRSLIEQSIALSGGMFGAPVIPTLAVGPGATISQINNPFGSVEIIWSSTDPPGNASNNSAVVLKVTVHGIRVLLTADIGEQVEEELVALHDAGVIDLSAEILKVPHHGSANSNTKEFLDRVFNTIPQDERYAIIQSGTKSFGGIHLPRESVVEDLRQRVGPGHLFSTQHEDEGTPEGQELDDDHVYLVVQSGGQVRVCYHPSGALPSPDETETEEDGE